MKKERLDKRHSFACSERHKILMALNNIKPETIRHFVETYAHTEDKIRIKSSEWKRLRDIIDKTFSLNVVGD